MPTKRLAEKTVITEVDDSLGFIITLTENFEGDKKEVLYKTTISAIAEALKKAGIDSDKSRFDKLVYNANTGYLHILREGAEVVKPCYIGKFAEVDENGVIPEENLPYFNKSNTLYANGKALYGTRFVDVTDTGEIIVREDGSGDYLLTVLEDGTVKAVKVKNKENSCKGYYFKAIDFDNKKIYLSKTQVIPVKITDDNRSEFAEDKTFQTPSYDLAALDREGKLYFSINNADGYYDFCGTIDAINHNVVTFVGDYDGELPFENTGAVTDWTKIDVNDYIFYVPTQPDVGLVTFATGGISSGTNAIASGESSFASGDDVVSGGRFSGVIGRFLRAGYAAFAINQGNKAIGPNSFAGGNNSETYAKTSFLFGLKCFIHRLAEYSAVIGYHAKAFATRVFVIGNGTQAHAPDQLVGGTYNAYEGHDDKLIIFGNGTSDGDRKNAFTLDKKGIGWFEGDVTVGENKEKLAKVNYVDEKIEEVNKEIKNYVDETILGGEW